MHWVPSCKDNFIVIPAQKVCEWAQFFLLPHLLPVLMILNPSRGWFWLFQFVNGFFCGQHAFKKVNIVHVLGFDRVTSAKGIVNDVTQNNFCSVHFVRMMEPFIRRKLSASEVLYAFRKKSRLVALPKDFLLSDSWLRPKLKELNWFNFSIQAVSTSRLLTRKGNK